MTTGLIKSRAETKCCGALSPSKGLSKRQPARPGTGRPAIAGLLGLTNSSASPLGGNTNGVLQTSPGLPSEATLGSRPRGANSNGVVARRQVANAFRLSSGRHAQALLATTHVGVGGATRVPRVARSGQPWASLQNTVGVPDQKTCRTLAKPQRPSIAGLRHN
jgi:hypothetical protein